MHNFIDYTGKLLRIIPEEKCSQKISQIYKLCFDKVYYKIKLITYKKHTHYAHGLEILGLYYLSKFENIDIDDILVGTDIPIHSSIYYLRQYCNLFIESKNKYICTINIYLFHNRYKEHIEILTEICKKNQIDLYIFDNSKLKIIIQFISPIEQYVINCEDNCKKYQVYLDGYKQSLLNVTHTAESEQLGFFLDTENMISTDDNEKSELFLIFNYFKDRVNWDIRSLTTNPNTTLNIIDMNENIVWYMSKLSENVNFTFEYFISHINWYKSFGNIVQNSNFTFKQILFLNECGLFDLYEQIENNPYETFALNQSITLQTVLSHPEIDWNICALYDNSNFNLHTILNNFDEDLKFALSNPSLTINDIEFIYEKCNCRDFFEFVCTNKNLTLSFIKKHRQQFIFASVLGVALNSIGVNIYELLDDPISDEITISHPNINIDLIKKYPNKCWNFDAISQNPRIRLCDIENNLTLGWNWKFISINPNLTLQFILKYWNKPWNFRFMSTNKFQKHPYYKHSINLIFNSYKRFVCMHIYKMLKVMDELVCKPATKNFCGGIVYQEIISDYN